jgi:uncharacterized membrane protein HdeD (DUF308 family)
MTPLATSILLPPFYFLVVGILLIVAGINKGSPRVVLGGIAFLLIPFLPAPILAVGFGICLIAAGLNPRDRGDRLALIPLGIATILILFVPLYLIVAGAGIYMIAIAPYRKDREVFWPQVFIGIAVVGLALLVLRRIGKP